MNNISADLIKYAELTPDAPALLFERGSLNYGALNSAVWRFAQHLHNHGVKPGDIIGLTINDEVTLVLTILGLVRMGATAFSIPRSATDHQRTQMIARAGIRFLAVDNSSRQIAEVPLLLVEQSIATGPEMWIDTGVFAANPHAPWLLIYGSGSTGAPKLIPITHGQTMARSRMGTAALHLTSDDRVTSLSHFDFSTSKFRLHEALSVGASFALGVWSCPDVIERIRRQSISVVYATVFHVEVLLSRLPQGATPPLETLRALELTASTVSDSLRLRIRDGLCQNLHVRYAINETGPVTCSSPPEVFKVSGTVGKPLPGIQIRIVDKDGRVLEDGEIGLIQISSSGLANGYWDNVEATQKYFRDVWFMPGDLGKLMPDGELIYFGRADFMMIMNGINIYPEEIEQMMTSHPAVQDAAVIPMYHRVHQDVPCCAITLAQGAVITEGELLQFATEKLGVHGPKLIFIFDRIPRNGEGKLIRTELLEMIKARLVERENKGK